MVTFHIGTHVEGCLLSCSNLLNLIGMSEEKKNHPDAAKSGGGGRDEHTREPLVSWREFTQATTFHGVKYMFDPLGFIWRRYMPFLAL